MSKIHESYYRAAADLRIPLSPSIRRSFLTMCLPVSKIIFLLSVSPLAVSFIPRAGISEARVADSIPAELEQRISVIAEALGYLLESAADRSKKSTLVSPETVKTCRITVPKAALRIGLEKAIRR